MGENPQPHTTYLVFIFLFTLSLATRTTGLVTCKVDSLPYPFGNPISFRCSRNGSAQIGKFAVENVTDANIYVNIPWMCTRQIRRIKQLFGDNFAPSSQNTFLLQNCIKPSYNNCTIKTSTFQETTLEVSQCDFNSSVTCFDGRATADVMSIGDVNRSGCKYWLTSVTYPSIDTTSGDSLSIGRLKLDWWLQEGCSNTTCSENANCTQLEFPNGRLGHWCTCLDGFRGNAFIGGCQ